VKAIIWERQCSDLYVLIYILMNTYKYFWFTCVPIYIHFSLECICFLGSYFSLSAFHLWALLTDCKIEDAYFYVKSASYLQNSLIDSSLHLCGD